MPCSAYIQLRPGWLPVEVEILDASRHTAIRRRLLHEPNHAEGLQNTIEMRRVKDVAALVPALVVGQLELVQHLLRLERDLDRLHNLEEPSVLEILVNLRLEVGVDVLASLKGGHVELLHVLRRERLIRYLLQLELTERASAVRHLLLAIVP